MQITIEPNKMSKEQRDAVINFIQTYPIHADTVHRERMEFEITADTTQAVKSIGQLQDAIAEAPSPETAFGKTTIISDNKPIVTEPVQPVAGAVDLDKNGFPWDSRIHSSNKAKVADGTWRKRRGIDDAVVTAVEAELRQVMGAPAAPSFQATQSVPPATPVENIPVAEVMPPIPPTMVRAPAPPAPNANVRGEYVALVGRTAAACQQKKISQEQVIACCSQFGVPNLPLLANRLDLVPQVAAMIDALVAQAA